MTQGIDSVHVGILMLLGYNFLGPSRPVIGLDPSLISKDVLAAENPMMTQTFLNQFIKADGNYPTMDFRTNGLVHSTKKQW